MEEGKGRILGNKSSVRRRSAGSSPLRRRSIPGHDRRSVDERHSSVVQIDDIACESFSRKPNSKLHQQPGLKRIPFMIGWTGWRRHRLPLWLQPAPRVTGERRPNVVLYRPIHHGIGPNNRSEMDTLDIRYLAVSKFHPLQLYRISLIGW